MITKEFVESLRDGDRVRVKHMAWRYPWEGQVEVTGGETMVAGFNLRYATGSIADTWDLEILERAPRFYKNVDRAPVPGDVCRLDVPATTATTNAKTTWTFRDDGQWWPTRTNVKPIIGGDFGIARPVLIVDGTNGLPVMPEDVQERLARALYLEQQ